MYKNLSGCEKVLLKSLSLQQYLVKMADVVKKYFSEITEKAEVWHPENFEGFTIFIPKAEGDIDAILKVCFWQQSSEDGSFCVQAPYKLDHIEFYSIWDEETKVDAYYNYCGDWAYSGWVTSDHIASDKVIPLCAEVFTLFQNLIISIEQNFDRE
jgi:hypothetical protein